MPIFQLWWHWGAHLGKGQVGETEPYNPPAVYPSLFFKQGRLSARLICMGLQHNEGLLSATFSCTDSEVALQGRVLAADSGN